MHFMTRRLFGQTALAAFTPAFFDNSRGPYPTVDYSRGPYPQGQGPSGRRYPYTHLDVFTDRPFEGNQLLVFLQPDGLDVETMHRITRESNYSECTFVFPPDQAGVDYHVRIFTRAGETPFAGHPTIGTAFALAHAGSIKSATPKTTFRLGVGPTPLDLEWEGTRLKFAWMTQRPPTFGKTVVNSAALAAALGLEPSALATERAPAQEVNCGSTFVIVPIATRKAVDAAVLDRAKVDAVFTAAGIERRGVYVFTTEGASGGGVGVDADAYTRLLGSGGIEDPATGSAAGPAGCFMVRYGFVRPAQAGHLVFVQGVLVGRPSRLHVNVTAATLPPEIASVKVGGAAVIVGDGSVTILP
jgi:trans-2,3-dihydro-3-hydroxyanthranilate isomerase